MLQVLDQLQRIVAIPDRPQRIVSLVPSQTGLLARLGLEKEVVGVTKFCTEPDQWFRTKTRIGGTKTLDLDKIAALIPDLIIAGKEENIKEQVELLAEQFPVWISDVSNYGQALQMIQSVGEITGRSASASMLIKSIEENFSALHTSLQDGRRAQKPRVAYLIWKDPYMAAGGDTYIGDMLGHAGFDNIFATANRYPALTIDDLQTLPCDLLLLSSEPYPFTEVHAATLAAQLPQTKVVVVDGVPFSWYGAQLEGAPAYFLKLRRQIDLMT